MSPRNRRTSRRWCSACSTAVRDESSDQQAVRIMLEPKSSRIAQDEFMAVLLAHTSLESSVSLNLTMVGRDGRPQQKNLLSILHEWIDFRFATVERRTRHRLAEVVRRIHILEGRMTVFLQHRRGDPLHPRIRRTQAGPDGALRPHRNAGRGHPRNPPAPAGTAGRHPHREGTRRPAHRAWTAHQTARLTQRDDPADPEGNR